MVLFGYRFTILGTEVNLGEVVSRVSSDIFTGQIIAALIIILFLAVFLLREWIVQNARPGVFGDPLALDGVPADGAEGAGDEVPPAPPAPAPAPAAVPQPPPVLPGGILPPPAPDSPTHANPLPFPLIESKTKSTDGEDPETRSYGDNSSVFALSRTPSPPIDADADREYIRQQRDHYFSLSSASSSKDWATALLPPNTETPAGPSRLAFDREIKSSLSSTSASDTDPLMLALPPSPPSSDGGYATTSSNRRGKLRGQQSTYNDLDSEDDQRTQ